MRVSSAEIWMVEKIDEFAGHHTGNKVKH